MNEPSHAPIGHARPTCDLNADLGESREASPTDAQLLEIINSANIACGGHAGNAETMSAVVRIAAKLGVAVGAHPSYPDRANFGRTTLTITPETLESSLRDQIMALHAMCHLHGVAIKHVKPHGALYHDASLSPSIADAIANAARAVSPSLPLVTQAGCPAARYWRSQGHAVLEEAFADRAYEPDGTLRPRSAPGALITDPTHAAAHALHILRTINPATLCIHSDTAGAVAIARAVRDALDSAGIECRAVHQ
jgi:UPF0271 protein